MGIFSRSKPDDLVEPARRHVRSVTSLLDDATKTNAKAHTALAEAISRRDAAQVVLVGAQEAYQDSPTDSNAKAIRTAREALELSELQLARPRAAAQDADLGVLAAQRAVSEAEAEVTRLEREGKIAALRAQASVEHFRAATNEYSAKILANYSETLNLAGLLEKAWAQAVEAAQALVEMGVDFPPVPLSRQHLMSGIGLAKASLDATGFSANCALDTDCGPGNPLRAADFRNLQEILRIHAIDEFDRPRVIRHSIPIAEALPRLQRILAAQDPENERLIIDREFAGGLPYAAPSSSSAQQVRTEPFEPSEVEEQAAEQVETESPPEPDGEEGTPAKPRTRTVKDLVEFSNEMAKKKFG